MTVPSVLVGETRVRRYLGLLSTSHLTCVTVTPTLVSSQDRQHSLCFREEKIKVYSR